MYFCLSELSSGASAGSPAMSNFRGNIGSQLRNGGIMFDQSPSRDRLIWKSINCVCFPSERGPFGVLLEVVQASFGVAHGSFEDSRVFWRSLSQERSEMDFRKVHCTLSEVRVRSW